MPPTPLDARTARVGLISLTSLFLAWGFITCLNDILVPHLRAVFTLSFAEAALVQSAFFLAYFCCSLPAAAAVARAGYKRGLVLGLVTMAVGAGLFLPAAGLVSFPLFLGALFILASGITLLQVTANPYVTLLGPPETGSSRLNLTQAFNALGTTIAPLIGGALILSSLEGAEALGPAERAASVEGPYLAIAVVLLVLAGIFAWMPLPEPAEAPARMTGAAIRESLGRRGLVLGVLGIFAYVGAEVSIGSFLVNYVSAAVPLEGGEREAARFVSLYWGGAMIGRFLGSGLMRYADPARLLVGAAAGAAALVLVSLGSVGYPSVYALLAVGLCNSIMFPTIFSLGIRGLGPLTGVGSGLMTMAIVGGAILPLLVGALADSTTLKAALAVPVLCYTYIAYYGLFSARTAAAAYRAQPARST